MSYQIIQNPDRFLFRAYDIRGVVDNALTANVVYSIARAYATIAKGKSIATVVIARDGRLSSPDLSEALQTGLREGGIDVIDIGAQPTPVLYFAIQHLQLCSGIMLTGSHNPANYNGLKMILNHQSLSEASIMAIYDCLQQGNLSEGQGNYQSYLIENAYFSAVKTSLQIKRPLKIVIDCGNGITGKIAPALFSSLGCDVISLYAEVDGHFPHHHPDPSQAKNLQDLITAVKREKADIGLAFDGDGDRLGVVTATGEIIPADLQMIIFVKSILQQHPGSTIIFDVKCTQQLPLAIERFGGIPLMSRTGHSLVKSLMKECGALFAGEMSGHLFFKDRWYGFDDGLYAGARLLEIISQHENSLDVFSHLPKVNNTPEMNIPISDEEKFVFVENFKQQANFPTAKKIMIDGLRVEFEDGWGLLRPSNTTPSLVCRFEADNPEALERIRLQFKKQLLAIDKKLKLNF